VNRSVCPSFEELGSVAIMEARYQDMINERTEAFLERLCDFPESPDILTHHLQQFN
jgi:hypothetical protein